MELKIEYLDKTALKPYVNNAKIHTNGQVEQIRKSIEEFDFNDPIAVWGENEIVEGHGRLLAAMEMDDIDTVPVIRLDHLTDKQRKAYALAHNKLTMNTDFDLDLLSTEIAELTDSFDLTDFGFNEREILELTIDDSPEEIQPLERHEPPSPAYSAELNDGAGISSQVGEGASYGTPTELGGISREEIGAYSEHAEQMVTRRVIIIYRSDEEESFLKEILGVPAEEQIPVIMQASKIVEDVKGNEETTN